MIKNLLFLQSETFCQTSREYSLHPPMTTATPSYEPHQNQQQLPLPVKCHDWRLLAEGKTICLTQCQDEPDLQWHQRQKATHMLFTRI